MAAAQYWVVNNSPPGNGPGGAAYTSYAIVRGTYDQAANIPNSGGISGPYPTLAAAYKVYRSEPQNKDVNPITFVGQVLGTGVGYAVYGPSPSQVVGAGQTGGKVAQKVENAVPGLAQIGTFFSDLSQASTWIRVAEVLAGLVLIAVGVARITHAVPIATKVAKAVGTKGLL